MRKEIYIRNYIDIVQFKSLLFVFFSIEVVLDSGKLVLEMDAIPSQSVEFEANGAFVHGEDFGLDFYFRAVFNLGHELHLVLVRGLIELQSLGNQVGQERLIDHFRVFV